MNSLRTTETPPPPTVSHHRPRPASADMSAAPLPSRPGRKAGRAWWVLAAVTLLTVGAPGPSTAAQPEPAHAGGPRGVGAPATVVAAGCAFTRSSADAVAPANGSLGSRGFVSFGGGNCLRPETSGRLVYFAGGGSPWFNQPSPYSGDVLAVSNDSTGTSVLFTNPTGTFIGQRTVTGSFTTPIRLTRRGNDGAVVPTGDLVTEAGRYWAVWTEQVGPGGEFAQTDLFQAKTIGQGRCGAPITRRQITRVKLHDDTPSLVLVPSGNGRSGAHLAWNRNDGTRGAASHIAYSTAACDANWSTPINITRFGLARDPEMVRRGNFDYLTFAYDDNSQRGTFPVINTISPALVVDGRSFAGRLQGDRPHIAVGSPTRIILLFEYHGRLESLRFHGICWHHDILTGGTGQQAVAVTAVGNAFVAFGISTGSHRLYAIPVSTEVPDPPAPCPPAG